MDSIVNSKDIPDEHLTAITRSSEFIDKKIVAFFRTIFMGEDLKSLNWTISSITGSHGGFDYLIITDEGLFLLKWRDKGGKPLYFIPFASLINFSCVKSFLTTEIELEIKESHERIKISMHSHSECERAVEVIKQTSGISTLKPPQYHTLSYRISKDNEKVIKESELFSGKTIYGLFSCQFTEINKFDFLESESEMPFSEKNFKYLVLVEDGIYLILPSKEKKKRVLSIKYDQIYSSSLEKSRLYGTTLVIQPIESHKRIELFSMEKNDGEAALFRIQSALKNQGTEIIQGWLGGSGIQWNERKGFDIIFTNKRITGKYNKEYEKSGLEKGIISASAGMAVAALGGGTIPILLTLLATGPKKLERSISKDDLYIKEGVLDQFDFIIPKEDITSLKIDFNCQKTFEISIINKIGNPVMITFKGNNDEFFQLISWLIPVEN